MDDVDAQQFGRQNAEFSFLQKLDTRYPYKLAIRMENHMEHRDDAKKLLKYAEYKMNEYFNSFANASRKMDLEAVFDGIAKELLARGGNGFKTTDVRQENGISPRSNRQMLNKPAMHYSATH